MDLNQSIMVYEVSPRPIDISQQALSILKDQIADLKKEKRELENEILKTKLHANTL